MCRNFSHLAVKMYFIDLVLFALSAIIVFQDGRTTWKPPWTYLFHVFKDDKVIVYDDKSDNWQRYLYIIEGIFMNKNRISPVGVRRGVLM